MCSKPEFLYFDLGNVLVHFDHDRAVRQLAGLVGADENAVRGVVFEDGLQTQYESGLLSSDQFAEAFLKSVRSAKNPNSAEVHFANSDIFWMNREIVPVIAGLKAQNLRIGILSNTCQGHWSFVMESFPIVKKLFSHRVLSFESHSMKPDCKIYEDAIAAARTSPRKIFFVDDKTENVSAAKRAGMDAHLFESVPQLLALLDERKIELNI